jgi:hypothetical protein
VARQEVVWLGAVELTMILQHLESRDGVDLARAERSSGICLTDSAARRERQRESIALPEGTHCWHDQGTGAPGDELEQCGDGASSSRSLPC